MAGLKRESTAAEGNRRGRREGGQGGGGRGRKGEETWRVIQGRRYGLPAAVARQREHCCVRWLRQISSGGKGTERGGSLCTRGRKGKVVGLDCSPRLVRVPIWE